MIISSVIVALAGQAVGADSQILRDSLDMAPQLPMYDRSMLDTSRGGIGTGLLNDTDVNQGVFAWNISGSPTSQRLDTPPDLSPINGGEVFGGTNVISGGTIRQETTHSYVGFDPTINVHIHAFEFSIHEVSATGFLPSGTSIGGLPIHSLTSEIGTANVGGNGMTFDGQVYGYFSASMDTYIGGSLANTEDFFSSAQSFAGANNEGGSSYADTLILQGFTSPSGPDIAGFNIDKLVIRGTVAVAVPTPASLALLAACGCTAIRRRR